MLPLLFSIHLCQEFISDIKLFGSSSNYKISLMFCNNLISVELYFEFCSAFLQHK